MTLQRVKKTADNVSSTDKVARLVLEPDWDFFIWPLESLVVSGTGSMGSSVNAELQELPRSLISHQKGANSWRTASPSQLATSSSRTLAFPGVLLSKCQDPISKPVSKLQHHICGSMSSMYSYVRVLGVDIFNRLADEVALGWWQISWNYCLCVNERQPGFRS